MSSKAQTTMSTTVDYNMIIEMEVLREFAAGIHASYLRYMDSNSINDNDMTNPVAINARDVFQLKDYIVRECETLDDLQQVRDKLILSKEKLPRQEPSSFAKNLKMTSRRKKRYDKEALQKKA
ncbi:MAG: hypothetical protein FWG42_00440 [Clostridiales bacterium]|nr:hypothetical protein [Clostridiales bacterium]